MKAKQINKIATARNILDKCNRSIGLSIDVTKFNEKKGGEKFLIECANFVRCEIVYN